MSVALSRFLLCSLKGRFKIHPLALECDENASRYCIRLRLRHSAAGFCGR
jgi:hypothetical protein